LKVIKVDTDENLLLVRGSVPGPSGQYIFIRKARRPSNGLKRFTKRGEGNEIMPVVDVVNLDGKKLRSRAGGRGVWREGESAFCCTKLPLVLDGLRRGTHKVKEKSEVSALAASFGSRRPGRAVSARSGRLVAHGGTVHGPPRAAIAMRCRKKCAWRTAFGAFREACRTEKLTIVDGWQLESHKTQSLVSTLEKLSFTKSALLVSHGENRNLELASRNLQT